MLNNHFFDRILIITSNVITRIETTTKKKTKTKINLEVKNTFTIKSKTTIHNNIRPIIFNTRVKTCTIDE